MDRRHLEILMWACLSLAPAGLGTAWSQSPSPRPGKTPGALVLSPGEGLAGARFGREEDSYRRLQLLPPEERDTFKRNLEMWHDLPPEQRLALRTLARARARAEIDKAMQDSGLHLDADQREVFALRYTQERRKLERNIQRQAAAERAQRMPEILARLKREFSAAPGGSPSEKPEASPAPEPKPEASATATGTPAPTAAPVR